MTGQLEDKVAIVTGGASGIGRASVLRFLKAGASVVAGFGDRVRFQRCDVSQESQVEDLIDTSVTEFGRLDCMFNNAGIGGAIGSITEIEAADWDQTFAVMVRGVFLGMKHATRAIRAHGEGGTIVNTASIAGRSGGAGSMAYSACKAAVINITQSAAIELAGEKIRVNAICPGLTLTPLTHRGHEADIASVLSEAQPWPEVGRPEYIADAALFLASEQSRFITGEYLVVDGGSTALGPGLYAGGNPAGNAVVERFMKTMGHIEPFREGGIIPAGFDAGNVG